MQSTLTGPDWVRDEAWKGKGDRRDDDNDVSVEVKVCVEECKSIRLSSRA